MRARVDLLLHPPEDASSEASRLVSHLNTAFQKHLLLHQPNNNDLSEAAAVECDVALMDSIFNLTCIFYRKPRLLLDFFDRKEKNKDSLNTNQISLQDVLFQCIQQESWAVSTAATDFFCNLFLQNEEETFQHAEALRKIAFFLGKNEIIDVVMKNWTAKEERVAVAETAECLFESSARLLANIACFFEKTFWLETDSRLGGEFFKWLFGAVLNSFRARRFLAVETLVDFFMEIYNELLGNDEFSLILEKQEQSKIFCSIFVAYAQFLGSVSAEDLGSDSGMFDCVLSVADLLQSVAIKRPSALENAFGGIDKQRDALQSLVSSLKQTPSEVKEASLSLLLLALEADEAGLGNALVDCACLKYVFPLFAKSRPDSTMKAATIRFLAALSKSHLTSENIERLCFKFQENSCEKLKELLNVSLLKENAEQPQICQLFAFLKEFSSSAEMASLLAAADLDGTQNKQSHGEKKESSAD